MTSRFILASITLFLSMVSMVYAQATTSSEVTTPAEPAVPPSAVTIEGTSAGGEKQMTIIDENGNLKVVEVKKPATPTGAPITPATPSQSQPATTTETKQPTTPAMVQAAPTVTNPVKTTPEMMAQPGNDVPAIPSQPTLPVNTPLPNSITVPEAPPSPAPLANPPVVDNKANMQTQMPANNAPQQ